MTRIMLLDAGLKKADGEIFYQLGNQCKLQTLTLGMTAPSFPPRMLVVCTLSNGNVYTKVEYNLRPECWPSNLLSWVSATIYTVLPLYILYLWFSEYHDGVNRGCNNNDMIII